MLTVLLSDMLKHKGLGGSMVPTQNHGMQADNLSMKMATKFTEVPAPLIVKTELWWRRPTK